jgi:TnpA family transposase
MDLDAPLPSLKPAKKAPKTISLETLYFYKDSHPLARDLLELGIIERRSFPIHSADSYRKIKTGEKPNAFHSWIKALRFPEEDEYEPNG